MLCAQLTYGGAHMRTQIGCVAMLVLSASGCGADANITDVSTTQQSTEDGVRKHAASPSTVCGGVLGLSCPSGQLCIDDPADKCDPAAGGRDCVGTCVVPTGSLCGGFVAAQCPAAQRCIADPLQPPQGADFANICVQSPVCGGFAHLGCPASYTCVDDPADTCDPTKHADCSGLCEKLAS